MDRKISVIGLGYVGLPVAVAFGKTSSVIGFDINKKRIVELREGKDNTREVELEDLINADIFFTSDPNDLRQADFHIIAVPTPIDEAKQPDLRPLLQATETIGSNLKSGDIVVYESTVYPGCTEELCVPILERCSGLKYLCNNSYHEGADLKTGLSFEDEKKNMGFYLGYSPERINPGDKEHNFTSIKKVISGSTPEVADTIAKVYNSVVKAGVHKASSIKVAEAAKVIENTQRDLNIAFVNELALIFNRLGIDTLEVLEAAGTKWNFLPFRPGLVGGHCIGVDPYYLTYRAERTGYHPEVILAGRRINDNMGIFVAQQTVKTMASVRIENVGSKVIILGLAFKEDCPDLRNSQVPNIIMELGSYGCEVLVHDPFCDPVEALENYGIKLTPLEKLPQSSALILAVAHKIYREWSTEKWLELLLPQGVVTDVKNIVPVKQLQKSGHRVWKL
jgi:UDP-N-acetyl-D-glucosamine/UDP-N-acetyl-D-galactosamine dehydrogenase